MDFVRGCGQRVWSLESLHSRAMLLLLSALVTTSLSYVAATPSSDLPALLKARSTLRHAAACCADGWVLLQSFPGEYENYMQWEHDIEQNVTVTDRHAKLHSIFFGPVSLPQFGDHIYYVQQYQNGVPTDVYRQVPCPAPRLDL